MNIFLSILQILGIVLLIVVIFFAILLFHPFFYQIEGEWKELKWMKGKFSWLFHLLHGCFNYEEGKISGEFFIFGKRIRISPEAPESDVAQDDNSEVLKAANSESEEKVTETTKTGINEAKAEETKKKRLEGNPKLIERIRKFIENCRKKIRFIREAYPRIKKILTDKQNHQAVGKIKDELICLIKILLPKQSSVRGSFSTGAPDTTGQVFGVLAMFPLIYTDGWAIVPDFQAEEAYFSGDFYLKGRVCLYQLAGIAIRIVLDKNCRRMYAMVQSFMKFMKNRNVQEDR